MRPIFQVLILGNLDGKIERGSYKARQIIGPYDVTGNFKLDFRAIGQLYLGAAFDFTSLFF